MIHHQFGAKIGGGIGSPASHPSSITRLRPIQVGQAAGDEVQGAAFHQAGRRPQEADRRLLRPRGPTQRGQHRALHPRWSGRRRRPARSATRIGREFVRRWATATPGIAVMRAQARPALAARSAAASAALAGMNRTNASQVTMPNAALSSKPILEPLPLSRHQPANRARIRARQYLQVVRPRLQLDAGKQGARTGVGTGREFGAARRPSACGRSARTTALGAGVVGDQRAMCSGVWPGMCRTSAVTLPRSSASPSSTPWKAKPVSAPRNST